MEGIRVENADSSAIRHITPGYFDVFNVPILEGRASDMRDRIGTPQVCVVSISVARKYFPNGGAVGRRVRRWQRKGPRESFRVKWETRVSS